MYNFICKCLGDMELLGRCITGVRQRNNCGTSIPKVKTIQQTNTSIPRHRYHQIDFSVYIIKYNFQIDFLLKYFQMDF